MQEANVPCIKGLLYRRLRYVATHVDTQLERTLRLERVSWYWLSCAHKTSCSVERAVDYIELLLACESHKVNSVSRNANRQMRVLLWVVHRVQQRVTIQHVHIHVIAGYTEKRVQHSGQIGNAVF